MKNILICLAVVLGVWFLPLGKDVTVFPYVYLYKASISLLAAATMFQIAGVNRLTILLSIPEFIAILVQALCYFTPYSRDLHSLVFDSLYVIYQNYSYIHLTLFLSQLVILGLLLCNGVFRGIARFVAYLLDYFSINLRSVLGAK